MTIAWHPPLTTGVSFGSCTNNGMAFTNDGRPSDAKAAFIDRSVYQNIRSIGTRNSDKNEFLEHMSKPEQKMKLSRFRLYVCLVGAVKLAIQGVPEFQPNLAYANTMFDYLDKKIIVGEYNLPRTSPRKSLKREENLRTLCIMKAVADVFVYKQVCPLPKLGLELGFTHHLVSLCMRTLVPMCLDRRPSSLKPAGWVMTASLSLSSLPCSTTSSGSCARLLS